MAETLIRLDSAAQLIAVHLRHDHVADDERGLLRCAASSASRRSRGGDSVAVLFEDVLQSLRLSCAVLAIRICSAYRHRIGVHGSNSVRTRACARSVR